MRLFRTIVGYVASLSAFLVVIPAIVIATGYQIVYFEEPRLGRRFGEAYREYKQRVPRFAPRLLARGAKG